MPFTNEHIWIIGASSGIGYALAKELANQGANLILSARSKDTLQTLTQEIKQHNHQSHHILPMDVGDRKSIEKAIKTIQTLTPTLDRLIFLAAVYDPTPIAQIKPETAKTLVEINLLGAIDITTAILPVFTKQGHGQIALCGSVAGYTGLPNGQPYSATKAAIINFAESLHAEVSPKIDVKLINPGFVKTPMTDKNHFDMPMRISAEDAAKAISKGLRRRTFEIHFPKRFTYLVKFLSILPYTLKLAITRNMTPS